MLPLFAYVSQNRISGRGCGWFKLLSHLTQNRAANWKEVICMTITSFYQKNCLLFLGNSLSPCQMLPTILTDINIPVIHYDAPPSNPVIKSQSSLTWQSIQLSRRQVRGKLNVDEKWACIHLSYTGQVSVSSDNTELCNLGYLGSSPGEENISTST